MSYAFRNYYQYLMVSPHHEYPREGLIYLGNLEKIEHPSDEVVPNISYAIPRLVWGRFEEIIQSDVLTTLKKRK